MTEMYESMLRALEEIAILEKNDEALQMVRQLQEEYFEERSKKKTDNE